MPSICGIWHLPRARSLLVAAVSRLVKGQQRRCAIPSGNGASLHPRSPNLRWMRPFPACAIDGAIAQAVTQKTIPGTPSKPSDKALVLIGHDTNLANVASLLNLTWTADGRRNDTPPGGALVFELWINHTTDEFSVRTYFAVQTLQQMRSSATLTLDNSPERVPGSLPIFRTYVRVGAKCEPATLVLRPTLQPLAALCILCIVHR